MVVTIKREKIRGKFFVVARDKRKIIEKRKWTRDFTIEKAKRIFRSNQTFDKNIKVRTLKSRPDFREFTDSSKAPKKPKAIPFRVIVIGTLKDGSIISASSMSKVWSSVFEARKTAEESFLERLAFELKDIYDADEGIKLMDMVVSIKQELIFVR